MIDNTINDAKTIADGKAAILAGRYYIIRQLGQGGMGSVWLAEDRQLDNRKVAIKMLPSIVVTDKRAYQQLKSEALVSLKLIHPNIVTLRAFEENDGAPFLVMDYIEGRTLSDYLAEKGKLSEAETIKLLKPIADALDYAHGEKVIHRDVKPSNIIIRNDGHPFILDFGIAREIQESMTRMTGRTISGTLLYMSPEQLRGAPPTPAQDVYSFAAMCYECLSGNPPFTKGDIAYQIINEQPTVLPRTIAMSESIMKGLLKVPRNRPVACGAVIGFCNSGIRDCQQYLAISKHRKTIIIGSAIALLCVIFVFAISKLDCSSLRTLNSSPIASYKCKSLLRRSLSSLVWSFYDDEYYRHSVEERLKGRQRLNEKGINDCDFSKWSWGIPTLAGLDMFYEQKTEEQEKDFREKVKNEFSEVNIAFKRGDYLSGNRRLNLVSHTNNSVYDFFNGVLSECRNDIKAAHRWYQLSAMDWCKEALFNLGVFYEFGVGVKADANLAAGYYQRAAIQGDKEALQRWQKLSGSNATVPDLKLMPVFERKPWPDESVLVKGTEFAALRDDVGRWWDVPFTKAKDFFMANSNQVDGKFFFIGTNGNVRVVARAAIRNLDGGFLPAVEKWDGTQMRVVTANDVRAVRNIVLYYILVTGKDAFAELNSGGKFEQVVGIEMANCDDGNGVMPIEKLMTDNQLLQPDLPKKE